MLALSVACAAAAVVGPSRAVGHGGSGRPRQWLPRSASAREPARWPDVTAVIPARNEAALLPAALPTLLGQDYPGTLTVILVDDCSSDGTAQVAGELARSVSRPGRALRVVAGAPLPAGWAGKVWAMSQGLAAAGAGGARPAY